MKLTYIGIENIPMVEPGDDLAGQIIDAAEGIDARVIVVSEYGLVPVNRPVHINRHLREAGWLKVRSGPFGEMLLPGESDAFAVADHQLAHVYVRDPARIDEVRAKLQSLPGIDCVVPPSELELDHPRSGELIALSAADAGCKEIALLSSSGWT